MDILTIKPSDDRYTVREALRRLNGARVLLVLPWETKKGWNVPLDFEVLARTAAKQQLEIAWVVEDIEKRALPREAGFPVFGSEAAVEAHLQKHDAFPALRLPARPARPRVPWWAEDPQPKELPLPKPRPWWRWVIEGLVFLLVLATLGIFAFLTAPSATIRLAPQTATYMVVVPISVDPTLAEGEVDLQRNVIPSRRIGDEFEDSAEVQPSGRSYAFSGKATGTVIFTNLLGQPFTVPKGAIVRTSSGSFPVRFETTQAVSVPPLGQVAAPVEALQEGPLANVDAYQINFMEGAGAFSLKVTNPDPMRGGESEIVSTVSEEDKTRVWNLAAQKVLVRAYEGLKSSSYLQPGEFLPRQDLVIQATPKEAYTHLAGEQTDTLGLTLRLLVTGEVIRAADAQAVAYRQLLTALPEGYRLTDARFEFGESAEEDVGPGRFTFYVTAYGYATANVDAPAMREAIAGKRVEEAARILMESQPLALEPVITVKPDWFPFLPRLDFRTQIETTAGAWQD